MASKKRGRGRPRLPARDRLSQRVMFRISKDQESKWKKKAKGEGFKDVSDWVVATCDAKSET